MTPTLEPSGVHQSPKGSTRYAIWVWTDADGELRIPCSIIDKLDRSPKGRSGATCATPRHRVAFGTTRAEQAKRTIMHRDGLIDGENRPTEKGAVIRYAFQRRPKVAAGFETPHGLRKRAILPVPF